MVYELYGICVSSSVLWDSAYSWHVLSMQVIDGGDLDINFIVSDPDRHPIVMEPHSMDGLHGLDLKKTGEYEICLDNSFSRMTGK